VLKKVARTTPWLVMALLLSVLASTADAAGSTTYTVDSKSDGLKGLSGIADRLCGDPSLYVKIAADNDSRYPGLAANPNLIHPGQVLTINCKETVKVKKAEAPEVAANVASARAKTAAVSSVASQPLVTPRAVTYATAYSVQIEPPPSAAQRVTTRRKSRNISARGLRQTPARQFTDIELAIAAYFAPYGPRVVQEAAATFKHESQLKLSAEGRNCLYSEGSIFTGWEEVSRACEPEDKDRAWSVDCGVAQINYREKVRGKRTCPPYLLTLQGNLAAARKRYEEQGFAAWVSNKKGLHRQFMAQYKDLGYAIHDTVEVAIHYSSSLVTPRLVEYTQP
jgi:hypothetical protein